jgi:membrane-associated phospholipid phosphatase
MFERHAECMRNRLLPWACVAIGLLGTGLTYLIFVDTRSGQAADDRLVPHRGIAASDRLLAAYDRHVVLGEIVVLAAVVVVAAWRGRLRRGLLSAALPLAVAVEVNAAQTVLPRPAFAADQSTHNSFPSGHVALAAATVIAVMLVLPGALRPIVAALGGLAVSLVAVATIAAGWHRFSDGLAAVLVSVAAGGAVVLASPDRRPTRAAERLDRPDPADLRDGRVFETV